MRLDTNERWTIVSVYKLSQRKRTRINLEKNLYSNSLCRYTIRFIGNSKQKKISYILYIDEISNSIYNGIDFHENESGVEVYIIKKIFLHKRFHNFLFEFQVKYLRWKNSPLKNFIYLQFLIAAFRVVIASNLFEPLNTLYQHFSNFLWGISPAMEKFFTDLVKKFYLFSALLSRFYS